MENKEYSPVYYTFDLTYNNNKTYTVRVTASSSEEAESLVKTQHPGVVRAKLLGWSQRKLRKINKVISE